VKKIRISDLEASRNRLENAISKYVEIIGLYADKGCADTDFQRHFTGFFRVRRDAEWRKSYFALFEKYRNANDGLFLLLWDLFSATGSVEASFATKLLAMIDPSRPIWDVYVLKNLGIKAPAQYLDPGVRIGLICDKMDTISNAYARLAIRPDMIAAISWLDTNFPLSSKLSTMKKMDFILWLLR